MSELRNQGPMPMALAPYVGAEVRTGWPLVLVDDPERPWMTIGEALAAWAGASIVRDNLGRLEARLLASAGDARTALAEAGEALAAHLALPGDSGATLREGLGQLVAAVPEGARLLAYGPDADLTLLLHVVHGSHAQRRAGWRDELGTLARGLQNLVEADQGLSRTPEHLAASVGDCGSDYLDTSALGQLMGERRGSRGLGPARLARVEAALSTLRKALDEPAPAALVLARTDLGGVATACERPCAEAVFAFERLADEHAVLARAVRTAKLELAGDYDPELHDAALAELTWEAFELDELRQVPTVVVVEDADDVVGPELPALLTLVHVGLPVQVLARVQAARNPGVDGALAGWRLELGHLGVAMRQCWVQQATPARPEHLVAGYVQALERPRAALHVVFGGRFPEAGGDLPWLTASAAVESRAHPLFRYDPDAGASWASCTDVSGNPDPDADWVDEGTSFTFADFALLDPALAGHFRPIELGVPIASWLALSPAERRGQIPVVETTNGTLAVDRALSLACEDRLRAWRGLRELAGHANVHVRAAADAARAEAEAAAAAEREALEARHAQELAQARAGAASEALEKLAASLLGTSAGDLLAVPAAPAAPRPAPVTEAPVVEAPVAAATPAAVEEDDDDDGPAEAWIDTDLCTSCNDCLQINPLLFVYDDNKQAVIGDRSAGTFEDLVRAAEKCPAKCIHPGAPTGPVDDDLVQRAAPFN